MSTIEVIISIAASIALLLVAVIGIGLAIDKSDKED